MYCIRENVLVCIGMYFGMYFGTYWYVWTWHVLVYVLTLVRIACIGMYWYVWHVLVCIRSCMYWYVLLCICMYGIYWYVWYVLCVLVCTCMYLYVWHVLVCMVCIVCIGIHFSIQNNTYQYIPIHILTYQYIPIHTKSKISIISTTKIRTHNYRIVRTIPNAVPTWPTISENSKVQLNTYTKLHADQIWIKTFWMDDMHQIKHNPTTWTWKQPPTPLEQYIP